MFKKIQRRMDQIEDMYRLIRIRLDRADTECERLRCMVRHQDQMLNALIKHLSLQYKPEQETKIPARFVKTYDISGNNTTDG